MKQILQDLSKGSTWLSEAPAPEVSSKTLLISTHISLVSAGTERMLVDFGRASYLQKARQQPEKVKMVLDKVKTDGLLTTIDTVRSKLAQPIPLGYSNVGEVFAVGKDVRKFKIGDRVLSNGPHADIVRVPHNLIAKIPERVTDEQAAFTVVGAIGLQGIRLAQPTLGEAFVVIGVGLIGLLTVQLLRAQGCRVLAVDFDETKLLLAKDFGADICNLNRGDDPVAMGMAFSRGRGVDGVLITASTQSNEPVTQAAQMCRKRGRIVLVGVVGLVLNRADFFEKELTFQVSCSYGPGRYDTTYEDEGHDYPFGFVRWTEQRNFEAVLDMLDSGQLNVESLITHRFAFDQAPKAYDLLTQDKSALGVLLDYGNMDDHRKIKNVELADKKDFISSKPVLGFIGAGNYASRILIPAFKAAGGQLHTIATSGGINGVIHGGKVGFKTATTDTPTMISNPDINTLAIVTQHNSHAGFVVSGLEAGKNIFVEKPLAITLEELEQVKVAYQVAVEKNHMSRLMVGFNRRFSPHIKKMYQLLQSVKEPKIFIMTINAGAIPADHWTQDIASGGGRIIGEACHFIDLMRFLAGSKIKSVQALSIGGSLGIDVTEDKASITLGFSDGSFGTIHYLANGSKSFPKERIEVFSGGRVLQLDNFIKLRGFGWSDFKKMNLWQQDKGQKACVAAFLDSIEKGHACPISAEEIFEVAQVSIEVAQILRS
jgi:threonine dehydrogenase-like Zn-dependent dehydrogenase/predicted dehydrogenase